MAIPTSLLKVCNITIDTIHYGVGIYSIYIYDNIIYNTFALVVYKRAARLLAHEPSFASL